jgi:nucleoside-diphosphate kinase
VVASTLAHHVPVAADLSKKPFFPSLVDFFSSGPIVAMVWEGHNSVRGIRQMMGTTNPQDSAPGSIRGDFCIITGRNIIHGSDAPESAKAEITHWFKPEEVEDWTPSTVSWVYETK